MKIKIKQYIIFFSILMPFLSGCKRNIPITNPNASFAKIYTLEGTHMLFGSMKAPDGGYLLWGTGADTKTMGPDGFLMKLDANQNFVWHKKLGGSKKDEIRSVCFDSEGNIMATGMSLSLNEAPSIYTVYLNAAGDIIWEKYFTAPSINANIETVANKVLYLPNGNFALVGSTYNYKSSILYINNFSNVYRPFILTINRDGDTIGTASYDVLLDDVKDGRCYYDLDGTSATLTQDGNILLLAVRFPSFADESTKQLLTSTNNGIPVNTAGSNLFKINPNIHFGYNNYIWKRRISNLNIHHKVFTEAFECKYFYPAPLKLFNTPIEQYMLCFPTLTNRKIDYAVFDNEGNLLSKSVPSTPMHALSTIDMEYDDGSYFLLSANSLSKMSQDGQIEWSQDIQTNFYTKYVSGIYPQEDKSVFIFCASIDNKLNTNIGCIKFNASGNIFNK